MINPVTIINKGKDSYTYKDVKNPKFNSRSHWNSIFIVYFSKINFKLKLKGVLGFWGARRN
jgi:hypothetical protein